MTNISTATRAELRETLRNMRAENLDVSTQLDLIHADIIGMNPVTFEHNGGNTDPDQVTTIRAGRLMVRCLAKNAAKTAAKLRSASRAPARMARRTVRTYPAFKPGMSTAQYINDFAHLNSGFDGVQLLPVDLSALMRPCALYENGALDFDAIEEPIDAPEATESPEMVAIVSELTGATMASIPREKAEELAAMIGTTVQAARQVSELIAIATTAAVIEQASEAAPMATLGEPVQPAVGRAAQNIDTTAQPVANQAESVQVNDATFESAGLKIYKRNVKSGDLVESRWIIQSPENAEREARGERQIGGDLIVGSREDAIKRSEQEAKRYADEKARKSEIDRKENEATAAEEARKAANRGKSIVERRADAALSKEVRDSETGTVMTRAQWVERRVNDGARPSIEMVDKIKPMSRTQFNRASNAEQRAHEAKIKAGGKVPEYSLGDYIVSKAEYDYAQKLIAESATKDQAQSVQVEPPPDECEPDPAPELATVDACSEPEASATTCDASSASNAPSAPQNGRVSSAQHQAPTKPTHDAHGQRIGQRVAGRSGHWCAAMFTDPDGRPSFEFEGPDGSIEVWSFETGRERMAALQAMAREADDAADQSNDASDADQPPAEQAGIESIKDAIRMNEREMERVLKSKQKGSKESAYRIELIISELADKLSDALKASKSTTTTGEYQQPAPVPKTETEADTKAADEVPRAVVLDSGQQSTSGTDTADEVPRAVVLDSGQQSTSGTDTADEVPRAVTQGTRDNTAQAAPTVSELVALLQARGFHGVESRRRQGAVLLARRGNDYPLTYSNTTQAQRCIAKLAAAGVAASVRGSLVVVTGAMQPPAGAARTVRDIMPTDGEHISDPAGRWEAWITGTEPRACVLFYRADAFRPTYHYSYKTTDKAREALRRFADEAEAIATERDNRKAERRAKLDQPHGLAVGDVLRSSWGYDQTNTDYFEVTRVIGKRTVEVRQLAEQIEQTAWAQGNSVPVPGQYVGAPMRRQVDTQGAVNILHATYGRAYKMEPVATVAGVRCFSPSGWSSYA